MRMILITSLFVVFGVRAESPVPDLDKRLEAMPTEGLYRSALGVTRKQTPIPFVAPIGDPDYRSKKLRILLVGGLDGKPGSVLATIACMKWFATSPEAKGLRESYSVAAVPCVSVEGEDRSKGYPPKGEAYASADNAEAIYLWRWLGVFAPDLVVVLDEGKELSWRLPTVDTPLGKALKPGAGKVREDSLASALSKQAPSNVGTIPALEATVPEGSPEKVLVELFAALKRADYKERSAARVEMQKRLERKPIEVAKQLAAKYGQSFANVEYITGMALVGRLWLGERAEVERILAPYVSGVKATSGDKAGPSQIAGHIVFAEMAKLSKDEKCIVLVRRLADRCLGPNGVPGHSDMSDSVFMGCPILAYAGKLTGEKKYYEACLRNLELMRKLDVRKDGLYRHSPLDETTWGRGNGFPALGLALSLSEMSADVPQREPILKAFREHLTALLKHQDADGSWHQVIDAPGSYRELTCTCMIAFAMSRGLREGWLEKEKFETPLRKAWDAISARVAANGSLIDVCTGTGKQKSLRDYYDRTAILGPDGRGGAMAMIAAVELSRK